jgi:hypothetical protein
LLLWFLREDYRRPPVFLSGRLFLFGVGESYIALTMVAIVTDLTLQNLYSPVANTHGPCRKYIAFYYCRISTEGSSRYNAYAMPSLSFRGLFSPPFVVALSLFSARRLVDLDE